MTQYTYWIILKRTILSWQVNMDAKQVRSFLLCLNCKNFSSLLSFVGCVYVLQNPDPNDPEAQFCFRENGDHPSECLQGKRKVLLIKYLVFIIRVNSSHNRKFTNYWIIQQAAFNSRVNNRSESLHSSINNCRANIRIREANNNCDIHNSNANIHHSWHSCPDNCKYKRNHNNRGNIRNPDIIDIPSSDVQSRHNIWWNNF